MNCQQSRRFEIQRCIPGRNDRLDSSADFHHQLRGKRSERRIVSGKNLYARFVQPVIAKRQHDQSTQRPRHLLGGGAVEYRCAAAM